VKILLWASTAFGHGGPPSSEQLLWGDSDQVMVTSTHGFFFEDGDWDWVCEEIFGTSLPTDVIATPTRILVASTNGLASSTGGCDWGWADEFAGQLIWDLALDEQTESGVWLVSETGLWHSDDYGAQFTGFDLPAPNASLRSVVPMAGGTLTLFGFIDGQATAWQGSADNWTALPLPVTGGHLIGLDVDDFGNVYGRFPRAGGSDELLRISADGSVTSILETDERIGALVAVGSDVMVSVNREGTWLSSDQGESWTWGDAETFACLVDHDDFIWGCPNDGSEHMWLRTGDPLGVSPKTWESGPMFSDVSEPRCGDELPQCELIWPTVALELGVDLTEVVTRPEAATEAEAQAEKTGGCGAQAAVFMAPWWVLWAGYRRYDA